MGHVNFLRQAKSLGDVLIVGVASDAAIKEDKGEKPIINQYDRAEMVRALQYVNMVHIYPDLEFLTDLGYFCPSILAVGEFWGKMQRHFDAQEWCDQNNCKMIVVPYTAGISSSEIKERIRSR